MEIVLGLALFILYILYVVAILLLTISAGILISVGHVLYCYLLPMFQVATSRLNGLEPTGSRPAPLLLRASAGRHRLRLATRHG
jgi:hypothetical protein